LGEIDRFLAVAEQIHGQLNDHTLMLVHQLGTGRLVACRTPLHERGFATADVRPTDDARLFQEVPGD
jgi:hypothetical protein